jgi:sigma-E factor negative regulatory protein RseB
MNKQYTLLLFVWLGLLQLSAQADDVQSSEQLINKMSDATRTLNYEGVVIFTRGNKTDVMQVLHKYENGEEREKMVSLTGHAREIIRNNKTVTCIFPDTKEVLVEKSRAHSVTSKLPDRIEAISDYYEFATTGEERIAGRDTWTVSITPKDTYRYGYQLWIDKESHLLLKSELQDETGASIEQVMFTQLEFYDTLNDELFKPSISGSEYTWYEYTNDTSGVAEDAGNQHRWQVTWMPAGFNLSNYDGKTMSTGDVSLEHMIYTDGVSMISVFVEQLGDQQISNPGSSKLGGVNVYSITADGYQVTAIGEVPQTTVQRMVESIVAVQ